MSDFAALYVRADGPYPAMTPHYFDEARDARTYTASLPVVAHPPCKRWGRFWYADGSKAPGEDGGLFAHALGEVRRCGGVLEHPEASHAFKVFDLPPPVLGAWARGLLAGEWSTAVYQGAYGHRARKLTWLFFSGTRPPAMRWALPDREFAYLAQPGRCSKGKPRRKCGCDRCAEHYGTAWEGGGRIDDIERITPSENELTPQPFADALAAMARGAREPLGGLGA